MKCTKEYRLSFTKEAQELVNKMSLEEKVFLMSGRTSYEDCIDVFAEPNADVHYNDHPYPAGGNERLGVANLMFCDGPRGVVCEKSTCFPVTMARGATFDRALEEQVGEAIAKEIRAYGGNFYGGVCINLPYNPGWGRSQESYGEDNFHLGSMGSALVEGIQKHNVIACIKHFAFNSMENGRFTASVNADDRTEQEVYLDHFRRCINSGAAAVMSSYNMYRGTYCGQQKHLLRDVLKKDWDFDGFVVSDFVWGTRDTVNAANGGLDVEMCDTHFYGKNLVDAVKAGKVPEAAIDEAALRIVRTMLAFSHAEDPQDYPRKLISCTDHIALAKKVAEESITLIQNKNNTLPFAAEKAQTIAVFGKLADVENIGDHGSSRVFPHYVVTPLAGITKLAENAEVVYYGGEDLEKAAQIAAKADAVVVVAGYDHDDEGEYIAKDDEKVKQGGDRKTSLGLHENEIALIQAVGKANANSAVVLIGGNMIMIDEWKDCVSSILMAYYPGMEGGTAIAEVLFGQVNPSGKLPFVIVKKESDLPQLDWMATDVTYDYYHGYTKLDHEKVEPSVPYGFGLSYTKFSCRDASFSVKDGQVAGTCKVKNIGKRPGDEVVQMYIGFSNSKVKRPVKALKGFARVTLQPGEEKCVEITCGTDDLRWYNENGWELEHMTYEGFIGTSSAEKDLIKGTFQA
ncbi:MAG: glycosyl hydrolase [Clostridiales bacterium]|nr:glycosyl hydrolase [Clostridiales bacterium]